MNAGQEPAVAGRALGGRYQLDEPLARGGMAQVWLGTDLVLGRRVAVKVLHRHLADDPAFAERFRREAQAAARLNDPHIVAIFDSVTERDISAIILEYVEGVTLRARMDESTLDAHIATGIGAQVAAALQAAHEAGIVHRDVKPANVLLCHPDTTAEAASPVPRVRVTDFGIAKALAEPGGQIDLTRTGSMLGTAKYLAPEQVQGGRIDPRTDVYALGVVLYEAVTGRVPWRGDSDLATAVARLTSDPIPPRQVRAEVPRGVESVILRALARDPDERFQTAADLRAALLAADPGPAPATLALPTVGEAPTFLQSERSWLVPALLISLVVGALVAGGVVLGRTGAGRSIVDRARGETDSAATSTTLEVASNVLPLTAHAYDPIGGDGENDDLAGAAVDGSTTGNDVWRTECYDGELTKAGVGLVVGTAQPAMFESTRVFTKRAGWTASLYLSANPAEEMHLAPLSAWGEPVVAELHGDATEVSAPLPQQAARSMLVLFTSVAGIAPDDCFNSRPNSHRVDVAEIEVDGQPT